MRVALQKWSINGVETSIWIIAILLSSVMGKASPLIAVIVFSLEKRKMYKELLLILITILVLANKLRYTAEWRAWYILTLTAILFIRSTTNSQFQRNILGPFKLLRLNFRKYLLIPSTRWVVFLPFLLIAIKKTAFSAHAVYGVSRLISYGLILWSIPILFNLALKHSRVKLFQELFTAIFLLLLIGWLWQFYDMEFTHTESQYGGVVRPPRFNGLFGNPNSLGIFTLLFLTLLFFTWRISPKTLPLWAWLLFVGFAIFNLLLSRSRTELLSFSVFAFLWTFPRLGKIVIPAAFLTFIFFREELLQGIVWSIELLGLSEWLRPETLLIGGGRWIAHELCWERIHIFPFTGEGWGFTEYIFTEYEGWFYVRGHIGNAHQTFLTVWVDTGIIGLIAFLFGWVFFFKKAYFNYKRETLALIMAIIVSISLESWLVSPLNPFTILFVINITLLADAKKYIKRT